MNRKELSTLIADEILKRYYYQRGPIEYGLKSDDALDKAAAMLAKPGEYARILNVKQ